MTASTTLISPMEAFARRGAAETVFLDVRTPLEHREVHIDGCQLVPLDRLDAGVLARELAGKRVVVVCRSGARARRAVSMLEAAGGVHLAVMDGGMLAWQAAGLPVVRGRAAVSLERQVRVAAGLLVLTGVGLGTWVHPGLYGLSALVGAGLVFAGLTDWCGLGLLLAKAPWNRCSPEPGSGRLETPTCCAG